MRMFLAALGWLVAFMLLGALAMQGFGLAAAHHHGGWPLIAKLAGIGAEFGLDLFVLAFCLGCLPGARRPPRAVPPFGLMQGVWGMAGFGVAMLAGGALFANLAAIAQLGLIASHNPTRIDVSSPDLMAGAALSGEVFAALFAVSYLRRLGPARLHDGSATGIGWRPARRGAYRAAVLAAGGIVALVVALYHFVPPDVQRLQNLPLEKLFSGGAVTLALMVFVAVVAGPVLEELVFRGIGFAGLATKLGPLWAGILTTFVFTAAHAPEKIHYLPSFADVALLAAAAVWLRLKYHSIRPGILLHILYNAGSMLAAVFIS